VIVKFKEQHVWPGIVLILIGGMMLLDRMNVLQWEWWAVVWAAVTVLGAAKIVQGVARRKSGKVFWGTVFFLLGGLQVLDYAGLLDSYPHYMVPFSLPVILATLGIAFIAMFLVHPREWQLLVPAVAFLGLGTVMILSDFGMIDREGVVDAVRSYWPVALIVFGIALVFRHRSA
jgi:hypothetical protein